MKIKFERSRRDRVTTSILCSQIIERRYSTDRTSAHMSCSMHTQHARHVIGILTAAHPHPDATIGDETFLDAMEKLQDEKISFVMSVRPSAWNNSAPTGRILIKFHISFFLISIEETLIKVGQE